MLVFPWTNYCFIFRALGLTQNRQQAFIVDAVSQSTPSSSWRSRSTSIFLNQGLILN
ncbi:MAG: hypothetical protein RMX68_024785 [Aulosira sp. ZfuVER01]|nr:hypothetical protein [Aulosira sp. DedVER01a]MDZ8054671.1 hypothetical protein [Aulosira sp. ZfuCHP01]